MPNRSPLMVMILQMLMLGLSSCETTTDPGKGGLLGGLIGLSTSAYEQRVEQRKESLARLNSTRKQLQEQETSLEASNASQQERLAYQKHLLATLLQDVRHLSRDVEGGERRYEVKDEQVQELQVELSNLKDKVNALFEAAEQQIMQREQLQEQRAKLEREYRLLLEIYAGLSE